MKHHTHTNMVMCVCIEVLTRTYCTHAILQIFRASLEPGLYPGLYEYISIVIRVHALVSQPIFAFIYVCTNENCASAYICVHTRLHTHMRSTSQ